MLILPVSVGNNLTSWEN